MRLQETAEIQLSRSVSDAELNFSPKSKFPAGLCRRTAEQPRPQGFSLNPFFEGKALGTRLDGWAVPN